MHKLHITGGSLFVIFVRILIAVVAAISIVGVSAAIISMLFGRPIGDDYGAISTYHLAGNWLDSAIASLATAGRYGQSITASVLYGVLGNKIVTILPLVVLAWFIALSFLYTRSILRRYTKDSSLANLASLPVAVIFTFLVLFINNPPFTTTLPGWIGFQLFFWPSGIITYTLPLLLLLTSFYGFFVSPLHYRLSVRTRYILFTILALISSLFNEIQPAFLAATSLGVLVLSYAKPYSTTKKYRILLVINTIISFVGLILMYFSPGRLTRSQFLDTIDAPVEGSLLGSTIRNLMTLSRESYFRPREVILLVLVGFIGSFVVWSLVRNNKTIINRMKQLTPYILLLPILCFLAAVISIILVVMGYGYTAGIYPRTMLIAQILYILSVPLIAFLLSGFLLSKFNTAGRYIFTVVVSCLGLLFLLSIPKYMGKLLVQVNSSVTYANLWIDQDAILRKAASNGIEERVYLERPATGIGDGFSLTCTGPYATSTMWLNVQIHEYYGSHDIVCAKEKE